MTEYRPIKFWQPKMRCSFWVFLILLLLYIKVIMNEKIRVLGVCLWRCRFNVPIKLNQISVYFAGMAKLSFELEVCRIPNLNVVGIRRKRLKVIFFNKHFFYKMFSKNFIFNFFFRAMPGATKKFAKKFCDWQLCHKSEVFFPSKKAKKIHNCLLFLMLSQKNMWTFHPILRTTVVKVFKKTPIGLNLKQYACWQQILIRLANQGSINIFWQHWYNLPIFCTVSVLGIKQMSFKLMNSELLTEICITLFSI